MTKRIIFCLVLFYGCNSSFSHSSKEVDLSSMQLEFVKNGLNYLVNNTKDFSGLTTDSFKICNTFDNFSKKRLPVSLESKLDFDSTLEKGINAKFFNKQNTALSNLTKSLDSFRRLSLSGFDEEWLFITYVEFNITDKDICNQEANSERTFVLRKKGTTFSIIVDTEAHFN